MAGGEDEAREEAPGSADPRLRRGLPAIGAAAAFAAIASLGYGVPAGSAILALLVIAALVVGGHLAQPRGRPGRSPVETVSSPWPDPGMRLILDALEDPCFLTDDHGLVRHQNRAAVERFGALRPGDPLSFKLRVPELLAAADRVGRGETVEPVRFTERVPTERFYVTSMRAIRRPRKDGRSPVKADFVLIRLWDETDLVRMERMRGDFIANASHELRTPLASLTGFVETLLGPARNDEVNRERFLRIMLEQAQRMSRLIDDLLSLSRIEMKAHVRPESTVDLGVLIDHVADAMDPLAKAAKGSIVRPAKMRAMVRGDRDELIQVLANLVENAVKYGGDGVCVTIGLSPEAGPDGRDGLALTVTDTGPGIAEAHLPRLTERFYRVDEGRSPSQKGTGLGLAIVKHIVNRHHGRLAIRSKPGQGTTVHVWLESLKQPVPAG